MTKTKDIAVQVRSPPTQNQSPSKKVRRKISSDNGEGSGSGPAPEVSDAARGEFTDAIDLTGISHELQQKMLRVAPVLGGRRAAYTKSFFCDVVGLCGEGLRLSKVQVIEREIQVKRLIKNSRHEIADCLDSDEAAKFSKHWAKVYGESPDNAYYSARFLKGCYATFQHFVKVNWAEEVVERRGQREEKRAQHPYKLGPVALRQQVAGLCKIIEEIEASPDRGVKYFAAAKDKLQQYQEDEVKARSLKRELLQQLNHAKEGLEKCYTDFEEDDLNTRYSIATTIAKLLRSKGDLKGASEKRAEAEAFFVAINDINERTKKFEDAIVDIEEELLPKAMVEIKRAQESVAKAKQGIRELTICPGCKDKMAKLENSADADPTRTPNPASFADPVSPVNPVADVDLASPPMAAADALPASPPKAAADALSVSPPKAAADALPASPPNCATKNLSAAEVEEMVSSGLVCHCSDH